MSFPNNIEQAVASKVREYDASKSILRSSKRKFHKSRRALMHLKQAQGIAQIVASTMQQRAHEKIARVVSRCLEMVFDQPYEFKILFEQKRGRTQAKLVFSRNGNLADPMTESGGGVVDVAAFALRLSCMMLSKPRVRRMLVLDEPFRFVSEEYRGRTAAMLEMLSKEMKVQFLIVTHINELKVGKIIQL